MELRRAVFTAIADPTIREIIGRLATSVPLTLKGVSENFEINGSAISKQMKILEKCDLVSIQKEGRTRVCQIALERINQNICMGRIQTQGLLKQPGCVEDFPFTLQNNIQTYDNRNKKEK